MINNIFTIKSTPIMKNRLTQERQLFTFIRYESTGTLIVEIVSKQTKQCNTESYTLIFKTFYLSTLLIKEKKSNTCDL